MEEIDIYIEQCREEEELKDYIHKNIYPERFKITTTRSNYNPVILNDISYEYIPIEHNVTKNEILEINKNLLVKIKALEQTIKSAMKRENDCPVCLENMDNSYVSPSCGHHICIKCFTSNIRQNNPNCELCCLCRTNIVR